MPSATGQPEITQIKFLGVGGERFDNGGGRRDLIPVTPEKPDQGPERMHVILDEK